MKKQPKPGNIILAILFGILFLLGITILSLALWYAENFGISFKELLYTIRSPLKGTGTGTIDQIVGAALPYVMRTYAYGAE